MTSVNVLGIESSCDETSIAVVNNGNEILSNVIYSQLEEHAKFGGVVPELASRAHLEKINSIYELAIQQSGITLQEIDAIAVTSHPGLTGSLMIGANFAKSLSLVSKLPVILVNHLQAHLYAVGLQGYQFKYPFLGLLLSGGNSAIYKVLSAVKIIQIADTLDDACGEAFDKAASILELGYPGGPQIEKAAIKYATIHQLDHKYREKSSLFPRLLKNLPRTKLGFSFSGIKTAVRHAALKMNPSEKSRVAFDFQNTVFELILRNLDRAVDLTGIRTIVASGGVLANGVLRDNLDDLAAKKNIDIQYPHSKALCTDNAAMVAAMGYHYLQNQTGFADSDFDVSSKSCLPSQ